MPAMIRTKALIGLYAAAVLVAGCGKSQESQESQEVATASPTDAAPAQDVAPASAGAQEASAGFDIEDVPVSQKPLGAFPYVSLPAGYSSQGYDTETKEFARFPFWVDGKARWVEGRFYLATFSSERGKDYSQYEVARNFAAMVEQMGGVKVSEGRIPTETVKGWGEEITQGFIAGLGDVYSQPATTYLVRRNDGNIWIHFVSTTAMGHYVVGQEKGFTQTAQLLPAAELRQQLDSAGKVALQVNFATDSTEILPDSLPQIDQVVQLLQDDASLKLAVNGHTDNTGDATHNQRLSEGRARAVMAALVGKGIAADRLSARGFGDSQPVADNGTEDGKARNRRVELVKQ